MVDQGKRRMKRKSTKVSSKSTKSYFKEKPKRQSCAISGEPLSGVPRGGKGTICKYSKTKRRPSVPFGGVLSGNAREAVFIEVGKVVAGVKEIDSVEQKYRKYVKQALNRVE